MSEVRVIHAPLNNFQLWFTDLSDAERAVLRDPKRVDEALDRSFWAGYCTAKEEMRSLLQQTEGGSEFIKMPTNINQR